MSRKSRWSKAEEYFVEQMSETVFTFHGFAKTTNDGHCCRCGQKPGQQQRLYLITADATKPDKFFLEYGKDCWPVMKSSLKRAIAAEADIKRRGNLEANLKAFEGQASSWQPDNLTTMKMDRVRKGEINYKIVLNVYDRYSNLIESFEYKIEPKRYNLWTSRAKRRGVLSLFVSRKFQCRIGPLVA